MIAQSAALNPSSRFDAIGLEVIAENRFQRSLFRFDLKMIHVNDKPRQNQKAQDVRCHAGPSDQYQKEAQIHWVAGTAVDPRSDQRRSRVGLDRIDRGFRPSKFHDAQRACERAQQSNYPGYDRLKRELKVESREICGCEPHQKSGNDDEPKGWDFQFEGLHVSVSYAREGIRFNG